MAEADPPQRRLGALASFAHAGAGIEQAVGDVVDRGNAWREVEVLEDESDVPRPQRRQLAVVEIRDVEAVDGGILREHVPGDDLDADSLDLVELVMALEEAFDIEVPEEELEGIETVGQAFDLVKSKIGA